MLLLVFSLIFLFIFALVAFIGAMKGRKYMWQMSVSRIILSLASAAVAVLLSCGISFLFANILKKPINCILVLGVYLADKYTNLKKLPYMTKQIIIGVLFGCVSAFASSYGVEWLGAVVNVRDAAPLSAGLIFGAPAGIISGVIGGLYRWFSVYWGAGTAEFAAEGIRIYVENK